MSILHLKGWEVTEVHEKTHDYAIDAKYSVEPLGCINCGSTKVYKHGTRAQSIADTPIHGKKASIDLTRNRYRCQDCLKTFLQPLSDVAESGTMTKRLRSYIEAQSFRRTFTGIAEDVGISEATIRNVFNEYIDYLDKTIRFETPMVLGLDEVHLLRHPRCVITNIEKGTIIGVLEDRNKRSVNEHIFWMPDKERIKIVTMDMWRPYRDAVKAVLPDAQIVVDKFHVVRMASQALESVRRGLRDGLNTSQRRTLMRSRFLLLWRRQTLKPDQQQQVEEWSKAMPTLGTAYKLKEDFYDIWDMKNRQQAEEAYSRWKGNVPAELTSVFKPVTTAMENWQDEAFAYFDHHVTNAVTEALNGIAKMMNRMGRGYSFKVIRAKMLYGRGMHEHKTRLIAAPPGVDASNIHGCHDWTASELEPMDRETDEGWDEPSLGVPVRKLLIVLDRIQTDHRIKHLSTRQKKQQGHRK